nr:hypothetical protein CFP56_68371 [Quercus suber]
MRCSTVYAKHLESDIEGGSRERLHKQGACCNDFIDLQNEDGALDRLSRTRDMRVRIAVSYWRFSRVP